MGVDPRLAHFLKIRRSKYRSQCKQLEKLFRGNAHQIDPKKPLKDRRLFKYWRNRRLLFSQVASRPIYMTDELWFSVTPELIAVFIAKYVKACLPHASTIMDVCCGGGGNTIQFAKMFPKVIGVDNSLDHLYCTFQNCTSYGVQDKVWLKYGSWPRLARRNKFQDMDIDCVFISPPWGGPEYLNQEIYDLEANLKPMGLTELLQSLQKISENIIIFLPRNSNLNQLSTATRTCFGPSVNCKVLYMKQNGYTKGILCIWGKALTDYEKEPEEGHAQDVVYDIDG